MGETSETREQDETLETRDDIEGKFDIGDGEMEFTKIYEVEEELEDNDVVTVWVETEETCADESGQEIKGSEELEPVTTIDSNGD